MTAMGSLLQEQQKRIDEQTTGKPPGLADKKVILEEKYFRRVEKFDGDLTKYKSWIFDLKCKWVKLMWIWANTLTKF